MKRVAVILAGGRSSRMGGRDKALAEIGGERLLDRVIARLAPQADRVAISGHSDYGTRLPTIADAANGPRGPAAGLFAAARWIVREEPGTDRFFTAPVDAPFLPADLIARLEAAGGPAVAVDDEGRHPTFACWTLAGLAKAFAHLRDDASISLRAVAEMSCARDVAWPGGRFFFNVNTPEDLEAARRQDEGRTSPR